MENLYRQFEAHKELIKIAKRLHKLDCDSCNGTIEEQKWLNRVGILEGRADDLANEFGLVAYHQTDPRGASLYLVNKEQDNGEHYSEGICIS